MNRSRSRTELVAILEAILDSQSEGKWDTLESLIQPTVAINDTSQQRNVFIAKLRSDTESSGTLPKLDSCVVDVNTQSIAARVIKTQATSSEEKGEPTVPSLQYQEIILAWFLDGQLSNLKTLQDNGARSAKQNVAVETPKYLLDSLNPTSMDLAAVYRNYIKSINDKTMEANFQTFCKTSVTHNTHEKSIAEYISLIQESQDAIQDLYFDIQDLVIDNESGRVAARLEFTGLPVKSWADAEPNGNSVKFHEHVMYWFDQGRIHWVWSIVDLDTYRKQLQADS